MVLSDIWNTPLLDKASDSPTLEHFICLMRTYEMLNEIRIYHTEDTKEVTESMTDYDLMVMFAIIKLLKDKSEKTIEISLDEILEKCESFGEYAIALLTDSKHKIHI